MNYAEARMLFATRRRGTDQKRLSGVNTWLRMTDDGFAVVYHGTKVVTIHPDGSYTLRTGGHHTVTTKKRINEYIELGRVYQHQHEWFWSHASRGPVAFTEGMRICPDGRALGDMTTWTPDQPLRELTAAEEWSTP